MPEHIFYAESNGTVDNPSEAKARKLYDACLDVDEIEKVGTKPVLDLIKSVSVTSHALAFCRIA